jgi:hypothetical protein
VAERNIGGRGYAMSEGEAEELARLLGPGGRRSEAAGVTEP